MPIMRAPIILLKQAPLQYWPQLPSQGEPAHQDRIFQKGTFVRYVDSSEEKLEVRFEDGVELEMLTRDMVALGSIFTRHEHQTSHS